MENDGSVGSLADGLSVAQLALPLVSEHDGRDERRCLEPLRREWTPELLGRHFVLSAADLEETRRCRGDENRLGFALTLLLVRFLNSAAVSPEQMPEAVVDFVSSQVEVESAVLAGYGKRRPQTRDDHAKRIRSYLDVRAVVASDAEGLLEFLIGRAMHRDDPVVLLDEAEEWLRRERILLPVERTVNRLVIHARVVAEQKIHRTITSQLTPEHRAAFEELLEQPGSETEGSESGPVSGSPSRRSSAFAWLKEPPRSAGEKAIKELARKLELVRKTRVEEIDLSGLNRNRVKRLARLGLAYHSPALRRFEGEKRWAIMAAALAELRGRITDDVLIARTFSQANTELAEFQAKNAKTVNQNLHVLRRATAVILDETVSDSEVRRVREAVAVLDGILHHETELPLIESVVDTHGYTESLFGLFELESKVFSPRIADLPDQRIYPMEKKRRGRPPKGGREPRYGELDALLRGPAIKRDLIRDSWDDMHKVAASLKDGTTSATLLVGKLNNLKRKSGVQQAIQELGRLRKTFFYLDYISDESLRLRIRSALNKGELLHSLARDLFFGQQGLFRERDYEAQLNRATCLSLLINAIAALEYLRQTGHEFDEEDVSHLSPLLSEHINIHGTYHFDLAAPDRREGLRPLRTSR